MASSLEVDGSRIIIVAKLYHKGPRTLQSFPSVILLSRLAFFPGASHLTVDQFLNLIS